MKFKVGDKIKVKKIHENILKLYMKTNKTYTVKEISVSDNFITLKSVFGLYHCSLFEKVKDMKFKDGDKVRVPIRLKEYMFPDIIKKNIGAIYTIRNANCGMVHLIEIDRYLHQDYLEKVEDMEEFKFGELVEVSNNRRDWTKRYYLCNNIGRVSGGNYYITFSKPIDCIADSGDLEYWTEIRKIKKEYSLQEIADALKVDVKDLRIKK